MRYRPWYVTKMFWDATPLDRRWLVADPSQGSRHNRGEAVDLTLYDLTTGQPVEMPSTYDESTDRAYADYPGGTMLQRSGRRAVLRRAMEAEGFAVNPTEWWHFDYKDWRQYAICNVAFDNFGKKSGWPIFLGRPSGLLGTYRSSFSPSGVDAAFHRIPIGLARFRLSGTCVESSECIPSPISRFPDCPGFLSPNSSLPRSLSSRCFWSSAIGLLPENRFGLGSLSRTALAEAGGPNRISFRAMIGMGFVRRWWHDARTASELAVVRPAYAAGVRAAIGTVVPLLFSRVLPPGPPRG